MQTADHILLPLLDGSFALAQIARVEEGRALLFLSRTKSAKSAKTRPIEDTQVLAVMAFDIATAPADDWPVIGYEPVARIAPFHDMPVNSFDPVDPAIIEAFANAIHGLYPWDGFPDADLFTNMLRDPDTLPTLARMAADFPKPEASE